MIQSILFPNKSKCYLWPTNEPMVCRKQTDLKDFYELKNSKVDFYPGEINDELIIDNEKVQVTRHTYMMKMAKITACTIEIVAKRIFYDGQIYKNDVRIVYMPTPDMELDTKTCWLFKCDELTRIFITKHIQFATYPEYSELFDAQIIQENDDDKMHYSYYMHNIPEEYVLSNIQNAKSEEDFMLLHQSNL